MKVYSSSKTNKKQQNNSVLNESIRGNIQRLSNLLNTHNTPSLSLSPSLQSMSGEEEALTLARQFVSHLIDPYQCMLLYPLIVDSQFTYPIDAIFVQTSFPVELQPLLSLYLHKQSPFLLLQSSSRKMIDIFYRLINEQAGDAFNEWLLKQENKSLGEWFYMQCIAGFFQQLFKEKENYTLFITNFLRLGLPYFFIAAISALRGQVKPPEGDDLILLQKFKLCYVDKYCLK